MYFPEFTGDLISARPFLVCLCLYPSWFSVGLLFILHLILQRNIRLIVKKKKEKSHIFLCLCLWEHVNTRVIDNPVQCIVGSAVFVCDGETEWVLSEIGWAALPVLPPSFVSILWGRTAPLANSKQCKCITRLAGALTTYKHTAHTHIVYRHVFVWKIEMFANFTSFFEISVILKLSSLFAHAQRQL